MGGGVAAAARTAGGCTRRAKKKNSNKIQSASKFRRGQAKSEAPSSPGPRTILTEALVLSLPVALRAPVAVVLTSPCFLCFQVQLSHKTPCHPSPQKQIGTPAQLREPTRRPLLYSHPVTRSPRKTPEGAKREEGGENAVLFLWGSRATGAPRSP